MSQTDSSVRTASSQTTSRRPVPRMPRTRDEVFAASTVVVTVTAVVLAVTGYFDVGAVVALLAVVLGGWSQLISETRFERFESVIAVVVAAVALAVCLAEGSGLWT